MGLSKLHMLTIRLQRKGKKNQPFFKIVVTEEKKSSTRGRFVEELGYYNPLTKERSLNGDRAKYWMSVGAQPSDTVYNMLVTDNIIEGKKRPKHKKSKKKPASPDASLAESGQTSQGGQPETAAPSGGEPRPDASGREAAPVTAAPAESTAPAPTKAKAKKVREELKEAEVPNETPKSESEPAKEQKQVSEPTSEESKEKTHNP